MAKVFGDEAGFFWDTPIKVGRTAAAGGPTVVRERSFKEAVPPSDYRVPDNFPEFSKYPRISVDLETFDPKLRDKGPGCYRKDGYIVGVGIRSDEWEGDYYPVKHVNGPNCDPEKVFRWLRGEFKDFKGIITGANLPYEGEWLATEEVFFNPLAQIYDTQWAEPLINENARSYKLEVIARKYLGSGKITNELKELYGDGYIENMHRVHPGHAKPYVMGDITLPMLTIEQQLKELEQQQLLELFHMERRLYPLLLYMKRQGVLIDMEAARQLEVKLAKQEQELRAELKHMAGTDVSSVFSAHELARVFARLGLAYPMTTSSKPQPSFTKEWLEAHPHRVAEIISSLRKIKKFKGDFINTWLQDGIDGRLHCSFHPLRSDDNGTVSGRFSSSNPNLQQVPTRDAVFGPLIRALFIPESGMRWWSKDYSQIEYRFLVHYAVLARCVGAAEAARMYLDDPSTDFHVFASQITGLERKKAKNINFGIVYGMGEETMAHNMGITKAEAKPILNDYHTRMPFCRDIYKKASSRAGDIGYVRTVLGRKRRFDLWEPATFQKAGEERKAALPYEQAVAEYGQKIRRAFTHKALNAVLQGSSADLTKLSMVKIWEAGLVGPGAPLTLSLTVHDELDGSAPDTPEANAALDEAHHIMANAIQLKIPVLVDSKTGANWAEAH